MSERIIIEFDENKREDTIREVLRLVELGYTSGINPYWNIEDSEVIKR